MPWSKHICSVTFALALACLLPASSLADSSVTVGTPINPGNSIQITGIGGARVYVYTLPSAQVKAGATCGPGASHADQFTLNSATPQTLLLANPVQIDDQVCAVMLDPVTLAPTSPSAPVTVTKPQPNPPTSSLNPEPTLISDPQPGATFFVTASPDADLYAFVQPAASATNVTDCKTQALGFTTPRQFFSMNGAAALKITLKTALQAGDVLCLASSTSASPTLIYSAIYKVIAPAAATGSTTKAGFTAQLISGSSTIDLTGQNGATIELRSFPANPLPSNLTTCESSWASGQLFHIVLATGSPSPQFNISQAGTSEITTQERLQASTLLCIQQTVSGSLPTYSAYQAVIDSSDYGRVRTNMTLGSIIDNQQSSANSSTAATYLDFGIYYSWMRAGGGVNALNNARLKAANKAGGEKTCGVLKPDATADQTTTWNTCMAPYLKCPTCKPYLGRIPGVDAFFNVMLSTLPVSAPAAPATTNTTTTTTGTGTTTTTTPASVDSLNIMSSQQSAHFVLGMASTWRLTRFNNNNDSFLFGPVVKAGFSTLINPSTTTTINSTLQTNSFSQTYNFNGAGLRLNFAQFDKSTDKAPVPFVQLDVTTGSFTNLPSYICNAKKPYGAILNTAPTFTTCYTTTPVTTGTGANATTTYQYTLDASRTVLPRINASGFAKLPNYPFILGLDANLGQYAFGAHHNLIDPLSKPGSDIRIYVGIAIDPMTLLKKLNLPTQ